MAVSDEDRILRLWTPILLRTILVAASIILVAGLALMATRAPGYYVERYRSVQAGQIHQRETFTETVNGVLAGDPHAIMTIGLLVLTLVPLGRVAFCFLLFVKEGDRTYVAFTAYVLTGLMAGIMLGRIG